VGRHSAREPNETTVRPDGMGQLWQPPQPRNQQPPPPCFRCGAPFAAHLDGRCPQPPAATTDRTIAEQSGVIMPGTGQPPTPWTSPPGAPPPAPRTAALKPRAVNWVRRHRLLTGAIVLVALLLGIGVINEVGKPSGNAVACSDYWSIKDTTNTADQVAGLYKLQSAAAGITNSGLSVAVNAFNEDVNNNDTTDASNASIAIGTACTALGYNNPG
jgi:hypothetical protein